LFSKIKVAREIRHLQVLLLAHCGYSLSGTFVWLVICLSAAIGLVPILEKPRHNEIDSLVKQSIKQSYL
jgi:hypothetical protein